MVQLVALGLVAALVWYAWTALKRQMASVGEAVREEEIRKSASSTPTLEQGADGVYRPVASARDKDRSGRDENAGGEG